MNYRRLLKTDLKIGAISFGCMSLGLDHKENSSLLNKALDSGINYFDTADLYQKGENEITVGKAFRGKRKEVIIATKVGNQLRQDGSGWDWNPTKDYILSAVEESLKRLQTDYIDLYQLHGGTIDDPIEEVIEAFEILKEQGKIRHYGISSIRPNVIREWVKCSEMVSVMMQYSLLDRRPEESCLPLLLENKIGVMARGVLAKGLLAGKPSTGYLGYKDDQIQQVMDLIGSFGRTPMEAAIMYVLSSKSVATAVIGLRSMEQLKKVIEVTKSPEMTQDEISKFNEITKAELYGEHR